MDLSNASKLADFSSGIGTQGAQLKIDDINQRVGIGTTNPQALLQVGTDVTVYGNSGIVSATSFYGSAEGLIGIGGTDDVVTESLKVIGISTFVGVMLSIGGTLTCEDVTDVNSIGVITARTGLKVTSGGINAPAGVVTATSFVGSGTALTGVEPGIVNLVASGTIDNGATVILKEDGTVGIITQTTSDTPSIGGTALWSSAAVYYNTSTYDTTNNKIVIAYVDNDESNNGKAVVGTVSGNTISFGAPVTFNGGTGSTDWTKIVYDPDQEKIVIAYIDAANSNHGTAIVGTVVGTATTFGTEAVFKSASINDPTITYDTTNNKIVIAFKDQGNNNYGTAVVGTVTGLGITFGPDGVFASAASGYNKATFDSDNSRVVVVYNDQLNSEYGTAVVGTVTGVGITSVSYTHLTLPTKA